MTIDSLADYVGLTEASRITGLSVSLLRTYADTNRVRSLRDPLGRRLLVRADVEKLRRERSLSPLKIYADRNARAKT